MLLEESFFLNILAKYAAIPLPKIPAPPVITTTLSFTLNNSFMVLLFIWFITYCSDNISDFLLEEYQSASGSPFRGSA